MCWRFRRFVCVLVWVMLAVVVNDSPGQMQSESGKAWKLGSQSSAEFVQIQVTQASSTALSGTVSIRTEGMWQGPKVKNFSGTLKTVNNFKRFDCACEDGMQFFGWHWPGNSGGRADDRLAVYFRPVASASEIEDCIPRKKRLIIEANLEIID